MNEFLNDLAKNIEFNLIKAVERKADGAELGLRLEKLLDKRYKEKMSERIQREVIARYLLEIIKGLYSESHIDYVSFLKDEIKNTEG